MTFVMAVAPTPIIELRGWTFLTRPARWGSRLVTEFAPAPGNALSEVFERVRRGDQQAFAHLYDELSPKIFGAVKRVLRDPAMSEEVTQEVFVEIWQQADRFDPERASVATWALTMARRRAVDRVRREQSQRNRVEALAGRRDDVDNEPAQQVIDGLEAGAVRDALSRLPEDQRDVLVLSFLEGLAHGEIADRLDIPLGTVKGRVRGGLKKLRAGLEVRDD